LSTFTSTSTLQWQMTWLLMHAIFQGTAVFDKMVVFPRQRDRSPHIDVSLAYFTAIWRILDWVVPDSTLSVSMVTHFVYLKGF
jgi:hypothetical protein